MPAHDPYRLHKLSQPARPVWRRPRRGRWRSRVRVRRTPTGVLGLLLVVVVAAGATSLVDGDDVDRGDVIARTGDDARVPSEPRRAGVDARADRTSRTDHDDAAEGRPPVFARYERLQLRLPHPDVVGVRFTEGRRVGAVPLEPVGTLTANANEESFAPGMARTAPDGPEFAVAAPVGRGRPATSAAVVTLPTGAWVGAPVRGEVEAVDKYPSGAGPDWLVIISPRTRTDLQVTITGLHRPRVAVGDEVDSGEILGAPRLAGQGRAEVAVEAGPAGAPTTLDVDEP